MIPTQAVEAALLSAANALEMQPPMLRAQYVAALRLYAADPCRLTPYKPRLPHTRPHWRRR